MAMVESSMLICRIRGERMEGFTYEDKEGRTILRVQRSAHQNAGSNAAASEEVVDVVVLDADGNPFEDVTDMKFIDGSFELDDEIAAAMCEQDECFTIAGSASTAL